MDQPRPLANQLTYPQVQQVIHSFYKKLLTHPRLGPYFSHIEDFSRHEKRISDFWWLAMGGQLPAPPRIDMINKHMQLGINNEALQSWLTALNTTLDEQLNVDQAKQWKLKAQQIAARLKILVIEKQKPGLQISEADKPPQH